MTDLPAEEETARQPATQSYQRWMKLTPRNRALVVLLTLAVVAPGWIVAAVVLLVSR